MFVYTIQLHQPAHWDLQYKTNIFKVPIFMSENIYNVLILGFKNFTKLLHFTIILVQLLFKLSMFKGNKNRICGDQIDKDKSHLIYREIVEWNLTTHSISSLWSWWAQKIMVSWKKLVGFYSTNRFQHSKTCNLEMMFEHKCFSTRFVSKSHVTFKKCQWKWCKWSAICCFLALF